tara:strand:+ start:2382 stop:3719 length:1338 start_codon:yes stop_codon:yes gene_type:complete
MAQVNKLKNLIVFKKLHLMIIWFFILAGININTDHFYINIFDNINNMLVYLSSCFILYIQFFILFFLLFLNLKENLKLYELNIFFYIFFFYNLIQIFSLFLSENNNFNIIYNICSINVLLFLNLIFYREKQEINKIFYFLISLLFIIFIWFYFESIYNLIFANQLFYGHYDGISNLIPDFIPPRSSGLGRMALIIFLFSIIFFQINSLKEKIVLSILIIPGIFLTQSRIIVFLYLMIFIAFTFSNYFGFKNLRFKSFKKNLVLLLIIPLLFSFSLSQLKESNINYLKNKFFELVGKKELINDKLKQNYKLLRPTSPQSFTSYRFDDWTEIISKSKKNYLIGNGTQADRYLINQTASNSLIYFYSSSGVFGVFLFILIFFNLLRKTKILIFNLKNAKPKNKNLIFSTMIIIILSIRSLVETSFAVFGVDYIFFIISLYLIANERKT